MEPVRWFDRIRVTDTALVGGKGANLGELTAAGLPVPPGFVVTAEAYRDAIEHGGIDEQLAALVAGAIDDPADLDGRSPPAQELIRTVPCPPSFAPPCWTPITSSATASGWRCARRAPARTRAGPPSPA